MRYSGTEIKVIEVNMNAQNPESALTPGSWTVICSVLSKIVSDKDGRCRNLVK